MTALDSLIAADQLKCIRALSVILADGTLPMPHNWNLITYTEYDPPMTPRLEGFFFEAASTPTVTVLRRQIAAYAEKFDLDLAEKPHGSRGQVGIHATGMWQGVDLHIWGPAAEADVDAQRADLHLDLADELLAGLAVRACYAGAAS